MNRLAALYALGLDWIDITIMKHELLVSIRRANNDLIRSFQR